MKFVLQKFVYLVLMLLIISVISFGAIHIAPNSFFASGDLNPNITPEALEQLKRVYGLEKSLSEQFFSWFQAILHLDFGISFASGKSVRAEILERLPITLVMNVISLVLGFVLSLYLGIKSALNQSSSYDKGVKQFSLISYAMPSFYLALIFSKKHKSIAF